MPPRPAKKAVTCPQCGASQQESPGVISTFCRSCSRHFELGEKKLAPVKITAPTWREKLAPLAAHFAPFGHAARKAA